MALQREELAAWLRLALTPGVGNATARKLLTSFGLPARIFEQSAASLALCASAKQSQALQSEPPDYADILNTTWHWLQEDTLRRRVLTLGDAHYPAGLLNMEDPPLLLYGIGCPQVWENARFAPEVAQCMAIVGSRNPTTQGAANAQQFALALVQSGLTVVSGMALGVDGAAHEGALAGAAEGQIATIAIVGTGLDRVYPRQHRDLAHRIARHGLLLSEYHLGTPPLSANFPKRNRIIAGLSRGTLVVEAALQSGSLITARLAVEQGKDVFAIPGSIHSTQARGCHALIKQGAKLVESAHDILEELTPGAQSHPWDSQPSEALEGTDAHEDDPNDPLWAALGFDPVGLDTLLARTGMDIPSLQVRLMELELEGHVSRLPGGLFQRQTVV